VQDFLSFFPKWGGSPLLLEATFTVGSSTVGLDDVTGISIGNPVSASELPDGTMVTGVNRTAQTITLSAEPTSSATDSLLVYNAPLVPFVAILAYIYLATASLVQARWQEQWQFAVALYVAHFLTLYAQSDGNPNSTVSQAAAQGLSTGIVTAKSVSDVSISFQAVQGLENWGAWNLTSFGQQLAQFARVIGTGPMLLV
jgi:hypothetical protein